MSGCALLYCFQDDLSVFKSIRLKVFKCPNKGSIFFFERRVCLLIFFFFFRSESSNLATVKMELFVTKVNGFQPLHIARKSSTLVTEGFQDLPLFFPFFDGRKA